MILDGVIGNKAAIQSQGLTQASDSDESLPNRTLAVERDVEP